MQQLLRECRIRFHQKMKCSILSDLVAAHGALSVVKCVLKQAEPIEWRRMCMYLHCDLIIKAPALHADLSRRLRRRSQRTSHFRAARSTCPWWSPYVRAAADGARLASLGADTSIYRPRGHTMRLLVNTERMDAIGPDRTTGAVVSLFGLRTFSFAVAWETSQFGCAGLQAYVPLGVQGTGGRRRSVRPRRPSGKKLRGSMPTARPYAYLGVRGRQRHRAHGDAAGSDAALRSVPVPHLAPIAKTRVSVLCKQSRARGVGRARVGWRAMCRSISVVGKWSP